MSADYAHVNHLNTLIIGVLGAAFMSYMYSTWRSMMPVTAPAVEFTAHESLLWVTIMEGTVLSHPKMKDGTFPFTQGFELIEGAGLPGGTSESSLYLVETTGSPAILRVLDYSDAGKGCGYPTSAADWDETKGMSCGGVYSLGEWGLPSGWFGEGVTHIGDGRLLAISWREREAVIYQLSLDEAGRLRVNRDRVMSWPLVGWGLAANLEEGVLYTTTGDSMLYSTRIEEVENPTPEGPTFHSVKLSCEGRSLSGLNELHYHSVRGTVLGVHLDFSRGRECSKTHIIYEVDPKSGDCVRKIDLSSVLPEVWPYPKGNSEAVNNVFNGIALLQEGRSIEEDRWLVTGKRWGYMFEFSLSFSNVIPKYTI